MNIVEGMGRVSEDIILTKMRPTPAHISAIEIPEKFDVYILIRSFIIS